MRPGPYAVTIEKVRDGLYRVYMPDGDLYDIAETLKQAKIEAKKARAEWRSRYPGLSRKNPTKAQKREKAKRTAAKSRIAKALQNFVRKANPAAKGMVKATKVKGGWNVRVVDVRRSK